MKVPDAPVGGSKDPTPRAPKGRSQGALAAAVSTQLSDTPTAAQDTQLNSMSSRPSCPSPVLRRRNPHPQATLADTLPACPWPREQLTPHLGLRLGCDPVHLSAHSFLSPLCTPPVSLTVGAPSSRPTARFTDKHHPQPLSSRPCLGRRWLQDHTPTVPSRRCPCWLRNTPDLKVQNCVLFGRHVAVVQLLSSV